MNDTAPLDDSSPRKLSEVFTKEEITGLAERSDLRGALAIVANWGLVAAAFALLAHAPGPVTFVVALSVIAGRQLGLAILQHEGSHRTLFRTKWLNDVLTDVEHHLLAGVPFYRLPKMHRMLREKGLLAEPPSYAEVLRLASSG